MKELSLILLLLVMILHVDLSAQKDSTKTTIAIPQFFFGGDQKDIGRTSSIQETVISSFVKAKRFRVIERTQMKALDEEWKTVNSGSGGGFQRMVDEGKRLGVQYLILGTINYTNIQDPSTSNSGRQVSIKGISVPTGGSGSYTGRVGLSLKVVNVETAEIMDADKLSAEGKDSKSGYNALDKAIEMVEKETDRFIDRYFPVMISIADQLTEKNGKTQTILIVAGSKKGYKKGDNFSIVKLTQLEDPDNPGKMTQRQEVIGEAVIVQLEETTSVCKVIKGNDQVNKGWKTLKLVTKEAIKSKTSF